MKVWVTSKLDKPNNNGVDFEVGQHPHPPIATLDDLFDLIESSEVADLHDYAFGRMLGLFTDGLPEADRRAGLFLVHLVTSILQDSFDHDQQPWQLNPKIGKLLTSAGGEVVVTEEFRPLIIRFRSRARNPALRLRFNIIMFDEEQHNSRVDAVKVLFQSSVEAARHLFRYAGFPSQNLGIATLEVAAFLASKYAGIVTSLDDIFCTIRYILDQDNSGATIKSELASLINHFLAHSRWKQTAKDDRATTEIIAGLRYEWVVAALNRDVWRVELLRDRLIQLFQSIDKKDLADEVWKRSMDLLQGFAEANPGGISDGVIERLLNDGKSRLTTEERKELIKLKRASVEAIVTSMKPVYGFGGSSDTQTFIKHVLEEQRLEDRLRLLFEFDYIPRDDEIGNILSDQAENFPLLSSIGVKRIVGDRDDGGTSSDPDFRRKETRLQYATYFMAQTAYPILLELVRDLNSLKVFVRSSQGWDDGFEQQFDRHVLGFCNHDPMQSLMYGISYLEGFLRRSLDNIGVSVDKEKEAGAVFHGSMFEALLTELETLDFESKEVEVFRLFLIEGTAGWNVRNHAYHGLAEDGKFDFVRATAVLYMHLKFAYSFRASSHIPSNTPA